MWEKTYVYDNTIHIASGRYLLGNIMFMSLLVTLYWKKWERNFQHVTIILYTGIYSVNSYCYKAFKIEKISSVLLNKVYHNGMK